LAINAFTALFVPKLELGSITLAFAATIPVGFNETTGTGTLAPALPLLPTVPFSRTDELLSLGDIAITPILLGWHSGTHFLSASLTIYAPTGEYDVGSLAIVGLGYWTFSPTLAYTYLEPTLGLDFSVKGGIDINLEHEETDYYSGALAHVDVSLTKNLTPEFGLGVFGSVLYQVEDDECRFCDQLDGFKGRSYAVGPLLKYTAKSATTEINLSLSWAHELEVEKRLKGDAVYFNMSGKF
jgi:hypothetical protein